MVQGWCEGDTRVVRGWYDGWYKGGTSVLRWVVRGWYKGGTRVVRGWYKGGARVIRGWYDGWYKGGTSVVRWVVRRGPGGTRGVRTVIAAANPITRIPRIELMSSCTNATPVVLQSAASPAPTNQCEIYHGSRSTAQHTARVGWQGRAENSVRNGPK